MSAMELWDSVADTLPWNVQRERQLSDFRQLLDRLRGYAVWHDRLRGVGEVSDLERLIDVPFTLKGELRNAQQDTNEAEPLGAFQLVDRRELAQITSSSGTTGAPTFFGLTHNDRARWNNAIGNAYRTAGVAPGSVVALTTGMAIVAGGLPYADGIREAGGTLAWIGGQTTQRMVLGMDRLKINVLVATASFATYFASRCEQQLGVPAPELSVRTVIAGGEPGAGVPHIRQGMLDAWGATRVSEFMGLGDVLPAMWAECHVGRGMHFTAAPDVLVELIDPKSGRHVPWEPGASGEAVYTTLRREAFPVVRFRSGDQLEVTQVECLCGRTAPTVRCVGRTDDMLIYKAMNVYPSAIREVVLNAAGEILTGTMRIRKQTAQQVRFDAEIPLEVELRPGTVPERVTELLSLAHVEVREQLNVRVGIEPLNLGVIPVSDYKNALTYVEGAQ